MPSKNLPKPEKFCNQCGQKTFRPHRSIKELVNEFVEDWLNFDSKVFKTARMLSKPGALSQDYFNNSHHKSHYVTPIKLYLILSIIFLLLTNVGGFNVTNVKLELNTSPEQQQEVQQVLDKTKEKLSQDPEKNRQALEALEQFEQRTAEPETTGSAPDDSFNCDTSQMTINLWPQWLDQMVTQRIDKLCDSYNDIQYLPQEKQAKAKAELGLNIAQSMIEVLPQTIFFALPILALFLGLFYLTQKRLYVEHLVLLMHSHSFMFAVILLYLGWYQLAQWLNWLTVIPMGPLIFIGLVIYLFYSQKNFYQLGYFATLWRFIGFSIFYIVIFIFLLFAASIVGLMSV